MQIERRGAEGLVIVMNRTLLRRLAPRWLGWYLIVLVWEALTTPGVSHSDSWRGVWLSLATIPFGAYRLGRIGGRPATLFIYGCGSAFLFVPRWLGMDRFRLWLEYQAPSNSVLMLGWILFTLLMGTICAFAASIGSNGANAGGRFTG
jgi:hypothetical protein